MNSPYNGKEVKLMIGTILVIAGAVISAVGTVLTQKEQVTKLGAKAIDELAKKLK